MILSNVLINKSLYGFQILREVLSGVLHQLQQHELLTNSAHNQNVVSPQGSLVSPGGTVVTPLPLNTSSGCNITPAINNVSSVGNSNQVLNASNGCNLSPVLYTSPDCIIAPVRTISGSYLN